MSGLLLTGGVTQHWVSPSLVSVLSLPVCETQGAGDPEELLRVPGQLQQEDPAGVCHSPPGHLGGPTRHRCLQVGQLDTIPGSLGDNHLQEFTVGVMVT